MKQILLNNKKASHDYEILEKIEAGISLKGFETKALRNKQGSLRGAYVTLDESGAFLVGANIPPYQPNNTPEDYDPNRPRKLLLHKKELNKLVGKEKESGLTIVPISVYNKGRLIKVEIAMARGKKKYDKRESIKARDTKRDLGRSLKTRFQ